MRPIYGVQERKVLEHLHTITVRDRQVRACVLYVLLRVASPFPHILFSTLASNLIYAAQLLHDAGQFRSRRNSDCLYKINCECEKNHVEETGSALSAKLNMRAVTFSLIWYVDAPLAIVAHHERIPKVTKFLDVCVNTVRRKVF